MHCKHLTREGLCEGRYPGYACIKKQCPTYKDAMNCEFKDIAGDYCKKYGRFGCVGRDSCQQLSDYLSAVVEEEQAQ